MNDRDTHFQGYANLLYPDLARLFLAMASYRIEGEEEKARLVEIAIKDVLARRAYDFSEHVLSEAPMTEYSTDSSYITDLTAWPEASS